MPKLERVISDESTDFGDGGLDVEGKELYKCLEKMEQTQQNL